MIPFGKDFKFGREKVTRDFLKRDQKKFAMFSPRLIILFQCKQELYTEVGTLKPGR